MISVFAMNVAPHMIVSVGKTKRKGLFEFTRKGGFPYWTLGFHVCGENDKTVGGTTVRRRAPFFAVTRPNTPYHVITTPKSKDYLEYFAIFTPRPEWTRLLDWPEEQRGAFHMRLRASHEIKLLRRAFEDLFAFSLDIHPEKERLMENALERILLLLQKHHADRQNRITDERVQRALNYLNANFKEEITLNDIAAHARLSPSRLAHLFTANTGLPPLRYLESLRIEAAKSLLLSTNDTIYMIADEVGFENPYHFSTRFRRRVGVSPRAFRERKY